jgi:hypothetical protein
MDIMSDSKPLPVFAKCAREQNPSTDNPRFTNGLAIQVDIKDDKETEAYTEKLAKAMEFLNEHGNHPFISQCISPPSAVAQKLIRIPFEASSAYRTNSCTISNMLKFTVYLT